MNDAAAITRASRSNLALAFIALPRECRADISTFYAFCRIVDDIADGEGDAAEKAAALGRWREALAGPCAGEPALAAGVREVIARHRLEVGHFHEIITGVEMDLRGARYERWEDLRLYCHRVASVVGLVSIGIFGAREPASREYAVNLGLALQLTNIIRDVGVDAANGGRVYLPAEDMARFGVSAEAIIAGRPEEGFAALMRFEAERARAFYKAACDVMPRGDRRALVAAEIMRLVYSRLLAKIEADGFRVIGRRHRIGRIAKLWCVVRGWLATR